MSNIRHTVVIRRDLGMKAGMVAAQAAHISDAFIRSNIINERGFSTKEMEWMKTPYISVLAVNNVEELQIIINDAKIAKLAIHLWKDTILSTVNPSTFIPDVLVGISIGPDDFDALKAVVGYLPRFDESMDTTTYTKGEM